ncbi:MAG: AAA family ATPase [Candidatus Eisenbacteria bacterium]
MNPAHLSIRNFLGITEADYDLSQPITLLSGHNGAGKSSTLDAIKFALTGRCRGTDAGGKGAENLIRIGTDEASVDFSWTTPEGSWQLVRTIARGRGVSVALVEPGGTTLSGVAPVRARLESLIGNADLCEATLDAPSFFALSRDKQAKVLATVVGSEYTVLACEEEARALGLSDPAVDSVSRVLTKLTAGRETFGGEVLEAAYQRAYTKRTEEKKTLKDLEAELKQKPRVGKVPTDEEINASADLLCQTEDETGRVREKIGALRARVEQRQQIEDQIAEAEKQLAAIEPTEQQQADSDLVLALNDAECGPSLEELQDEVLSLEDACGSATASLAEREQARKELKDLTDREDQEIVAIESGAIVCPSIHAPAECPLSAARKTERTALLPGLKKQAFADKQKLVKACTARDKARKDLDALESGLAAARLRLKDAQRKQAEIAERQAQAARSEGEDAGRREAIEQQLADLRGRLSSLGDPQADLSAAEQRLFGLQRDVTEARRVGEDLASQQRLADERTTLEVRLEQQRATVTVLEEIVPALGPKGIPARLIQRAAEPLMRHANLVLDDLTDNGYALSVTAGDAGLELEIWKAGNEEALPIEMLSTSERLRIGVALGAALCGRTLLGVLVVDNVDILDADNKQLLGQVVRDLGNVQSVISISTREKPAWPAEGIASYWIEGGVARAVEFLGEEVTA